MLEAHIDALTELGHALAGVELHVELEHALHGFRALGLPRVGGDLAAALDRKRPAG